jgi:hypothetical protein
MFFMSVFEYMILCSFLMNLRRVSGIFDFSEFIYKILCFLRFFSFKICFFLAKFQTWLNQKRLRIDTRAYMRYQSWGVSNGFETWIWNFKNDRWTFLETWALVFGPNCDLFLIKLTKSLGCNEKRLREKNHNSQSGHRGAGTSLDFVHFQS